MSVIVLSGQIICTRAKIILFGSIRRFTSEHASKQVRLKSPFRAMINIWFLQNHTFIRCKFLLRFFNSVEGMSRRDCLVSLVSKHVVFTSWFHSVIHFCIWSCPNVNILLLVSKVCIYKTGYCSFFEELIVFSKLKSSIHNRECSTLANLDKIEYGEWSLDSRLDSRSSILARIKYWVSTYIWVVL